MFQVEVTGTPRPRLTWYHNGEEVRADYSKELAEDGSLTIPSAELKHSGVYQLVVVNPGGRVEREVMLSVESESVETNNVHAYETVPMGDAIPVAMFGDHVEQRHARSNKPFKDEYGVRLIVLCCDRQTDLRKLVCG